MQKYQAGGRIGLLVNVVSIVSTNKRDEQHFVKPWWGSIPTYMDLCGELLA